MTIAVGLTCSDGIVFCADRQITDQVGLKYERNKILSKERDNPPASLMVTYSGNPDQASMMFDKLWNGIELLLINKSDITTLFDCKYSDGLKTLITFSKDGSSPQMFRTDGEQVHDASVEFIGAGDSSVVRYLSDLFLNRQELTTLNGRVIAFLLVSAANQFVDGCSGGPDIVTLSKWGHIEKSGPNAIETYSILTRKAESVFSLAFDSFPLVELQGVSLEALKSPSLQKESENILARNQDKLRAISRGDSESPNNKSERSHKR